MKTTFTLLFCMAILNVFAQDQLEWKPNQKLQLTDFKSPQSKVDPSMNNLLYLTGAQMEFSYQMTVAEFTFTKNFNNRVKTVFRKSSSTIIANDSTNAQHMVALGNYEFDLVELYSRKLRKALYENKNAFSDARFFQPIHEKINDALNQKRNEVSTVSDLGRKADYLQKEHELVLKEIEELADFAIDAKPKKKKKNKAKK
ncbi:hypothetical protein [Persicobacter diffluens]